MRKLLLFVFLLFLVLPSVAAGAAEAGSDTWDFGKVAVSGGIVKHVFSLKNDSAQILNITGTYASCGCTTSDMDKNSIKPGESASLEVRFDPKGYSGPITQYVYVNTNSKKTPLYKFTVKADVSGAGFNF
ncbi:MAG: DUF1573 domain-containing protein [Candidatus Omnitrophica bacterium]|nr:DUF1573 domain-containing protein [Candidatus Omnitrophota bacterium]MDD5771376.1 DUF1573 domain-containing protein [Candidatus Omnitrophota bacterium]